MRQVKTLVEGVSKESMHGATIGTVLKSWENRNKCAKSTAAVSNPGEREELICSFLFLKSFFENTDVSPFGFFRVVPL